MEHQLAKKEELLKVLDRERRKGTKVCLHVRIDAPIEGEPDKVFPCGLASYIDLSYREAAKLVENMLTDTLQARGARIPFHITEHTREGFAPFRTLWIG